MPVTINGSNTPTAGGVFYGDGTQYLSTGAGTPGQVLTSAGAAPAVWSTILIGDIYVVKTTAYTAVSSDKILANTSGGAFTITLPATPAAGNTVYIQDSSGTFATSPLTVARNGSTIMGLAEDMIVSTNGVGFGLTYNGSDWRIY